MTTTLDHTTQTTQRAYAYPFVNDWRRGCWVARPTGKADRDYVYQREFLQGTTNKATGTIAYTLDDLGGPGWIVAKDSRGRRALVFAGEFDWQDMGDVDPRDVLEVVRYYTITSKLWDGQRCPECDYRAILEGQGPLCEACTRELEDETEAAEHLAAMPKTEAF